MFFNFRNGTMVLYRARQCLFLNMVDIFCLFPDVVDSRFTERVDSLPDIVNMVFVLPADGFSKRL